MNEKMVVLRRLWRLLFEDLDPRQEDLLREAAKQAVGFSFPIVQANIVVLMGWFAVIRDYDRFLAVHSQVMAI